MEAGEVQILKGAALTVTDRRIITLSEEIPVTPALAPLLEATTIKAPAREILVTIGAIFFGAGLFLKVPMLWFAGIALAFFGWTAKVNRPAFTVSVETGGARKQLYTTASEKDAQLALAALNEALRRAAA
ncbi:hypothetical protein [Terricaulis sp.]|uniref:hypothetical protein n=1 Tax=Terricaulis sp. TaxID=2768686 RepID=UPI0037839EE9